MYKLIIELAIYNNNKDSNGYDLLTAEYSVSDEDIETYKQLKTVKGSFINKLSFVSKRNKAFLRIVEDKLLKIFFKNDTIFCKDHKLTFSYAYFAFLDGQEATVFSAPHVTSSNIFNPTDAESTYTLLTRGWQEGGVVEHINLFKKVDRAVLTDERNSMYTIKRSSNEKNKLTIYDSQTIVNSLLDYHKMVGPKASPNECSPRLRNFRSVYEEHDEKSIALNLITLSSYELKQFLYIS